MWTWNKETVVFIQDGFKYEQKCGILNCYKLLKIVTLYKLLKPVVSIFVSY